MASSPNRAKPFLSLVLSFRNEESNIPELLRRLRAVLDSEKKAGQTRGWELIFVNDDSTDKSEALLKKLDKGRGDIRIITTSRPFGPSPCVLAGMEKASGDAVIYLDSDLQDPPEIIPGMLRLWREDPDLEIVHTRRLSRSGESRIKLAITWLGYLILNKLASIHLPRNVGDYKLVSRKAVDELIAFKEKRPYMRGLVCWIGFKQVTVDYHREARMSGKTKFPVISAAVIRNFLDSALISFSDAPLRLASLLGFLLSAAAILGALGAALYKLLAGADIPGNLLVILAIFFVGGIQLLAIGILGLYLSSVHLESRRRPNYIVKSTYGFRKGSAE